MLMGFEGFFLVLIKSLKTEGSKISQSEGFPWNPSDHHSTMVLGGGGLRGTFNGAFIMPRDASRSDSQCGIFQAGSNHCPLEI